MMEKNFRFKNPAIGNVIELFLVLVIGFGYSIYLSTKDLIRLIDDKTPHVFDSTSFYGLTIEQVIALALIAFYLKYRNWSIKDFNLDFKFEMIAIAVILVLLRKLVSVLGVSLIQVFDIDIPRQSSAVFHPDLIGTILVLIVNSIYEEALLIGYLFKRLQNFHPVIIIAFSFIIRESYHTYQNWGYLPHAFSIAIVFGVYYALYKKLWPVIIAHGLGNLLSFL